MMFSYRDILIMMILTSLVFKPTNIPNISVHECCWNKDIFGIERWRQSISISVSNRMILSLWNPKYDTLQVSIISFRCESMRRYYKCCRKEVEGWGRMVCYNSHRRIIRFDFLRIYWTDHNILFSQIYTMAYKGW